MTQVVFFSMLHLVRGKRSPHVQDVADTRLLIPRSRLGVSVCLFLRCCVGPWGRPQHLDLVTEHLSGSYSAFSPTTQPEDLCRTVTSVAQAERRMHTKDASPLCFRSSQSLRTARLRQMCCKPHVFIKLHTPAVAKQTKLGRVLLLIYQKHLPSAGCLQEDPY